MFTIFENLLIYSQFFSKVFQLKKLYSNFLAQSCESWMSSDISTLFSECFCFIFQNTAPHGDEPQEYNQIFLTSLYVYWNKLSIN